MTLSLLERLEGINLASRTAMLTDERIKEIVTWWADLYAERTQNPRSISDASPEYRVPLCEMWSRFPDVATAHIEDIRRLTEAVLSEARRRGFSDMLKEYKRGRLR